MEMVSDDDMKDKKGTDKETNSDSEGLMIDEGSNSSIEAKSNSEIPKDKKGDFTLTAPILVCIAEF